MAAHLHYLKDSPAHVRSIDAAADAPAAHAARCDVHPRFQPKWVARQAAAARQAQAHHDKVHSA